VVDKSGTKIINFVGVGVQALTYGDMLERIDKWRENKEARSRHIACINAYCLAKAIEDKQLRDIYNTADIAGPDGMPFVYWIRWIGGLRCDRFYAPDVLFQIVRRAREREYSFYFYGGAPQVLEKMIIYLKHKYPYINIVGFHSPPFRELTPDEDQRICEEINSKRPDILCVGLGTPKQDYWIDSHIYKIRGSVMISSGATFDFLGGRIRMAPRFVQRSGFEWLFRLLSPDFRRLLGRYTIMHGIFLYNFALQLLGLRWHEAIRRTRPESISD